MATRNLSLELKRQGTLVIGLHPGTVDTGDNACGGSADLPLAASNESFCAQACPSRFRKMWPTASSSLRSSPSTSSSAS
eukprot:scaffold2201_cov240-Pinguiococcus_pyrenoidosus.AAC.3